MDFPGHEYSGYLNDLGDLADLGAMLSPSSHTDAQTLALMLQEQLDAINQEIRYPSYSSHSKEKNPKFQLFFMIRNNNGEKSLIWCFSPHLVSEIPHI